MSLPDNSETVLFIYARPGNLTFLYAAPIEPKKKLFVIPIYSSMMSVYASP